MTRHRSPGPAAERGGADAAVPPPPAPSWPRALRAIRAWLSPWIALQRWWPAWSEWLLPQSGPLVAAPRQPGNAEFTAIEPAPGRYVKARAE